MVVPARQFCDRLVADQAESFLLLPQTEQLPSSSQAVCYLYTEPVLEVDLPSWIERIRCTFHFDVPFDWDGVGRDQTLGLAIHFAVKDPLAPAAGLEILAPY